MENFLGNFRIVLPLYDVEMLVVGSGTCSVQYGKEKHGAWGGIQVASVRMVLLVGEPTEALVSVEVARCCVYGILLFYSGTRSGIR